MAGRSTVPRAVRQHVLDEFNHLCAICAAPKPHLHHIDEDPSNNAPLNLLPLCPNHHLTDQHNPTHRIAPGRLRLFRIHKDPAILCPQFEPLYRRLEILQRPEELQYVRCLAAAEDLCAFVAELNMGRYFAERIAAFMMPEGMRVPVSMFPGETPTARGVLASIYMNRHVTHEDFAARLHGARELIVGTIVELLRYQDWRDRSAAGTPPGRS